jgi:hypothetical protein
VLRPLAVHPFCLPFVGRKLIYLALRDITKKWKNPPITWKLTAWIGQSQKQQGQTRPKAKASTISASY